MTIELGTKLIIKSGNALHTVTVSHIIDEKSKEPWYLGVEKDNNVPILFFPWSVCIIFPNNKFIK
jgi:hypothetical protein